jgi:hypothetical protein
MPEVPFSPYLELTQSSIVPVTVDTITVTFTEVTPFFVLLATPLNSNTIRVYLSREPRHFSPLSEDDVLNRLNWTVSVQSGPGTNPVVESVENAIPQPDFDVDYPRAWSVDLRVDRRIRADTVYLTIASSVLESAAGQALLPFPDDRDDHPGDSTQRSTRRDPLVSTSGGVDFNYDTFTGLFVLDSKRDLSVHSGEAYLKKRILRRLMSSRGGFFHLANYGVGLKVKEKFDTTTLMLLKNDIQAQILQEEDVESASVSVSTIGQGVLLVSVEVKTARGSFSMKIESNELGEVVVA